MGLRAGVRGPHPDRRLHAERGVATMNREQMIEKAAAVLHGGVSSMGISGCPIGSCRDEHRARAVDVLDTILPQVTTVEGLEALADQTVLVNEDGVAFMAWMMSAKFEVRDGSVLTVVWSPS